MLKWVDNNRMAIGDINFYATENFEDFARVKSTVERFVIAKPRWMIEKYREIVSSLQVEYIFELGIYKGGSCVLFEALAKPQKLIAVDINEKPLEALEQYIDGRNLRDVIKLFYGVDQSDDKRLKQIISEELPNNPIDLVVDDASHCLDETRKSFNSLFPYLRPGGLYVIEDWPWAHAQIDEKGNPDGLWKDKQPLTVLIFEIILSCASNHGLIDEILINKNSAIIKRGSLEVDERDFDISKRYLGRGRKLISGL
jgi:cephalosporin hydroxylase